MGTSGDKQTDPAAFQPDPLQRLTVQDALIISAVYAVDADAEKCNQIKALAQKYPLFAEKAEDVSARVNKFTNLMQVRKPLKAVEAAARDLKPEHRLQAFDFAAEAALADKVFTEKKKKRLQTLAAELALDHEFVDRKLAEFQERTG